MSNIFPVQVEKATPFEAKFIEWKIHNVCNYNCEFCGDKHKDGSQRWLPIEKYKTHVDKLAKLCEGSPYWIQLTGGEPTLMPEFIELVKYIKQKGAMVSLISNGSRTLRWWQELKEQKCIDFLYLTYHSAQTNNYQHIADISNLFHDEPVEVICLITHEINTIDLAFKSKEYLVDNTGAIIIMKAMMISDYDIYSMYTNDQKKDFIKNTFNYGKLRETKIHNKIDPKYGFDYTLKITYNNKFSYKISPQLLMKKQQNTFLGWDCDIGKFNMRIDGETVYRGVCEVGDIRHLSDDDLAFTNDFVKCTQKWCFCGTDMIAKKIRPNDIEVNNEYSVFWINKTV